MDNILPVMTNCPEVITLHQCHNIVEGPTWSQTLSALKMLHPGHRGVRDALLVMLLLACTEGLHQITVKDSANSRAAQNSPNRSVLA